MESDHPMSEALRILLVEDDHRLSGLIAAYLERSGLTVNTAGEGESAIQPHHGDGQFVGRLSSCLLRCVVSYVVFTKVQFLF